MSRLCCADPHLYLRYQQGLLETDVCLKLASALNEGYPVSSGLLQTYSEPLGEMAKTATSTSSDVVFPVEDVSSRTLGLFVGIMYGRSLQQACTICDVLDLSWFGHRYNIQAMQPALCQFFLAQDSDNVYQLFTNAVKLYETVPVDFEDLQDVLFNHIMRVHTSIVIKIQPRHVNLWLKYLHELPRSAIPTFHCNTGLHMLSALRAIHRHKVCPGS